MPFYEALKFILTTTNTRVKRISWDDYYLTKSYDTKYKRNRIIIVGERTNLSVLYTPSIDDLVSEDWVHYN